MMTSKEETPNADEGRRLSEGLGLSPEREGQPPTLTITGPVLEAGHWYSPAEVRALLAAERERWRAAALLAFDALALDAGPEQVQREADALRELGALLRA